MQDFLSLVKERYSVRKLSDAPVEQEKVDRIIEAALAAPTATNNQPFRLWVIGSDGARERFGRAAHFKFVKEAPVIIVLGASPEEAWVRDKFDGHNYADVDAAIVGTHVLLEAHDLGLGTTWVGHFDPEAMVREFPEMAGFRLLAMFGIGYPAEGSKPSPMHDRSRAKDELVHVL